MLCLSLFMPMFAQTCVTLSKLPICLHAILYIVGLLMSSALRDTHLTHSVCVQMRSLDPHPERLKVITQQVEEEQALIQSQTLLRLQQIHAADRQTHSPQVRHAQVASGLLLVICCTSCINI